MRVYGPPIQHWWSCPAGSECIPAWFVWWRNSVSFLRKEEESCERSSLGRRWIPAVSWAMMSFHSHSKTWTTKGLPDGSPTAILYCRYSMPYRRNDSKILVVLLRRIWGVLITRNKQQNQDAVSVGWFWPFWGSFSPDPNNAWMMTKNWPKKGIKTRIQEIICVFKTKNC